MADDVAQVEKKKENVPRGDMRLPRVARIRDERVRMCACVRTCVRVCV